MGVAKVGVMPVFAGFLARLGAWSALRLPAVTGAAGRAGSWLLKAFGATWLTETAIDKATGQKKDGPAAIGLGVLIGVAIALALALWWTSKKKRRRR